MPLERIASARLSPNAGFASTLGRERVERMDEVEVVVQRRDRLG